MAQHSASSERDKVGLATRVSQSPPVGLVSGGIAILVMLLAVTGVLPRPVFFVGAAGLMVVAYRLDKRFKPAPPVATQVPPVAAEPIAGAPPAEATPTPAAAAAPAAQPSAPPPTLLSIADLNAEHARLTRELTDRVDDDEDVRFEKFMRLRRIEDEIGRQKG
jgi:hypothetical protein